MFQHMQEDAVVYQLRPERIGESGQKNDDLLPLQEHNHTAHVQRMMDCSGGSQCKFSSQLLICS